VNARPVALSILLVLVAVVIQTTLFGPGRIQPFGAAPMLVLSVVSVANRIYYTYLALNQLALPSQAGPSGLLTRAFFWTDDRATLAYDLWVIVILSFVWLTPPAWIGDPTGTGPGLIGWFLR
jgi:hypothetical protein